MVHHSCPRAEEERHGCHGDVYKGSESYGAGVGVELSWVMGVELETVGDEVVVRENYALGGAGRSRGEMDRGDAGCCIGIVRDSKFLIV